MEVKQVDMPESMLRAMAKQAEAEREKRSKIIHAEGEFSAAQRLVDAAHLLSSEPASIQLRYLQTLTEIGVEKNTTVVFPVPIDFFSGMQKLLAGAKAPAAPAERLEVNTTSHATAQQDTEITLGTGRMLGHFFRLCSGLRRFLCHRLFARPKNRQRWHGLLGERCRWNSGGRRSALGRKERRCPAKLRQSGDFSFYKAVGEKNADAALTPPDAKTQPADATAAAPPTPRTAAKCRPDAAPASSTAASSTSSSYYVQVAAVTRQEDADALVEALKKKAVSRLHREQYFRRQVLSRSGRTLRRLEGRRGHARPPHQRWLQSDCEKVEGIL